jgi:hypothetical protein
METFVKVCEKIKEVPVLKKVCLSGGEPTLHPQFWRFVDLALESIKHNNGIIQISTNGTMKESALKLAELARKGILEARLSYTKWHNRSMVEKAVVAAFLVSRPNLMISEGFKIVSATGRAASNGFGEDICYWNYGWNIDPAGNIFNCGCRKERLGSVFDDENILFTEPKPCSQFGKIEDAVEKIVERELAYFLGHRVGTGYFTGIKDLIAHLQ